MKKLILLLAMLVPMLANSMKIETNEIDEFTGKRTVITSWESLDKGYVHIRFRHQAGHTFLDFKYISEGAIVISKGASLMFKSTTDSIARFSATATYSGGKGDGAVGISGAAKWGISATYEGSVDWFSTNVTRLIRLYMSDSYKDFKVNEKDGYKLQKLALLLNGALNNDNSFKVFSCTLSYLKKAKGKKSWEVVKEEILEDILPDEMNAKIDEWKAKSDGKYEYDVKIEKHK